MNPRTPAKPSNRLWLLLIPVVVLGFLAFSVIRWINTPADVAPASTSIPAPTATVPAPSITPVRAAPTQAPVLAATATDVFAPASTATAVAPTRTPPTATRPPQATVVSVDAGRLIQHNIKVYALDGHLAYEGDVDLRPVLARIAAGQKDPHPNDGSVFTNVEKILPVHTDRNYYHEYVVRTPNLREVGPQRLIIGGAGDTYYTADHYAHFTRIK